MHPLEYGYQMSYDQDIHKNIGGWNNFNFSEIDEEIGQIQDIKDEQNKNIGGFYNYTHDNIEEGFRQKYSDEYNKNICGWHN